MPTLVHIIKLKSNTSRFEVCTPIARYPTNQDIADRPYLKIKLNKYFVMADRRITPTSVPLSSTTGSFLNFFLDNNAATRAML